MAGMLTPLALMVGTVAEGPAIKIEAKAAVPVPVAPAKKNK